MAGPTNAKDSQALINLAEWEAEFFLSGLLFNGYPELLKCFCIKGGAFSSGLSFSLVRLTCQFNSITWAPLKLVVYEGVIIFLWSFHSVI